MDIRKLGTETVQGVEVGGARSAAPVCLAYLHTVKHGAHLHFLVLRPRDLQLQRQVDKQVKVEWAGWLETDQLLLTLAILDRHRQPLNGITGKVHHLQCVQYLGGSPFDSIRNEDPVIEAGFDTVVAHLPVQRLVRRR